MRRIAPSVVLLRVLATLVVGSLCACAQGTLTEHRSSSERAPQALADLTQFQIARVPAGGDTVVRLTPAEAAEQLAGFDVILIGENHDHPGNHLAEMALYRAVESRAGAVDLSLEQFERDVQPTLDDYLAGRIGEATMRKKARAWENYPESYRPLVEYAKEHGHAVVAAEAPTRLVRCVGQRGPAFLQSLTGESRTWAATDLDLGDGAYERKFMAFLAGDPSHGGETEAAARSYAAQVTRDETMAESIVAHLHRHPDRKIVHLTGYFHVADFLGTPERIRRRDPHLKIAVVAPVLVSDPNQPRPTPEDAHAGTLLLLLRPLPEPYVNEAEMRGAMAGDRQRHEQAACDM